ncbi:hypothetical protein IW15_13140 [Chryseobacterium soli]|uniref:Uncharacterized protein n=1 Tax=Chryseobacterium soli TaxID=445961 RepID=A0A086A716_9FLAO|nr:hypothetical protein IW15_13140 [Chryseobacterium soli]
MLFMWGKLLSVVSCLLMVFSVRFVFLDSLLIILFLNAKAQKCCLLDVFRRKGASLDEEYCSSHIKQTVIARNGETKQSLFCLKRKSLKGCAYS